MLTYKQAKDILKKHPYHWHYDEYGPDLVCDVCGCNMEGMEYKAIRTHLSNLKENANKPTKYTVERIRAGILKYGPEVYGYDKDTEMVNTCRNCFLVKKEVIDPEYGKIEKIDYEYPEGSEIVDCPNCKALETVFTQGTYLPFWINLRFNLDNFLYNLKPHVLLNTIGQKLSIFGWKNNKRRIPYIMNNKQCINSFDNDTPGEEFAEVLIYGYDKPCHKWTYMIGYWRPDTQKFYIAKDCDKENDMASFWRIEIDSWIKLRDIQKSEFEDI